MSYEISNLKYHCVDDEMGFHSIDNEVKLIAPKGHRVCGLCTNGYNIVFGKKEKCTFCNGKIFIKIRYDSKCEKYCCGYGTFSCMYPNCKDLRLLNE